MKSGTNHKRKLNQKKDKIMKSFKNTVSVESNGKGNRPEMVLSGYTTLDSKEADQMLLDMSMIIPVCIVIDRCNKEGRKRVARYYIQVAEGFEGMTMDKVKKMNDARDAEVLKLKYYTIQGVKLR